MPHCQSDPLSRSNAQQIFSGHTDRHQEATSAHPFAAELAAVLWPAVAAELVPGRLVIAVDVALRAVGDADVGVEDRLRDPNDGRVADVL